MELSALNGIGNLDLVRDGSFYSAGYSSQVKPDQLSVLADKDDLFRVVSNPKISCLITTKELAPHIPADRSIGLALSDNPLRSFLQIHNHLAGNTCFYGTKKGSSTGKNTRIHPTAVISETDVIIGNNCSIGPHVTVYDGSVIGDNVTLGPGTTIGSERTDYVLLDEGFLPVIQAGGVWIRDDAAIHANCSIARATFGGYTEIGSSVNIDNLVHIGRGAKIGTRAMIVALAFVGDNVSTGSDVWIGPGSVISDDLTIGDRAYISLGSVVTGDVLPGQQVTGNFAIEHKKFLAFLKKIR